MHRDRPLVIVITGATASGKTSLAIEIARELGTEIISADSRQIYAGLPIGTAAPIPQELAMAKHHLVGVLPLDAYYSAAMFEEEALRLLPDIFSRCGNVAVVAGGSMMYIDALCNGIDDLPTITPQVREKVATLHLQHGLEGVLAMLEILDPEYFSQIDKCNTKRVMHALEIVMQSGKKYSELRTGANKERPFDVMKFAIDMPREQLFSRINARVDAMIEEGLEDEARAHFHLRNLNSLNTVGYKELFAMFDGEMDRTTAIARIGKNTRVYAKKQLTWLKRAGVMPPQWIAADNAFEQVMDRVKTIRP